MKRTVALLIAVGVAAALGVLATSPPGRRAPERPPPGAPVSRPEGPPASASPSGGPCVLRGAILRGGAPCAARVEVSARWTEPGDGDPLLPAGGAPVAVADTAGGSFAFEDLPPGDYEVAALAAGGGHGFALASLPAPGSAARVEIRIAAGPHTLEGTAVLSDGTPFRGTVRAFYGAWHDLRNPPPAGGRSFPAGAGGRFSVPGLEAGVYHVEFLAGGRYETANREVWVPYECPVAIRLDPGPEGLKGRVIVAGERTPVAGARVEVLDEQFRRGPVPVAGAFTAADGSWSLAHDASEAFLSVTAEGFAPFWESLDAVGPEIVVPLSREAAVSGRVVDAAAGSPVAGVAVFAVSAGGVTPPRAGDTSGPDGVYRLRGLGRRECLYALGNGWASAGLSGGRAAGAALLLETRPGGAVTCDLEVIPLAPLRGTVRDADGRPFAGAIVSARPHPGAACPAWFPTPPNAISGTDGAYALAVVAGVPYEVTAAAPARRPANAGPFAAGGGPADLHFPAPREARIRVVSAAGGPVEGAGVWLGRDGTRRFAEAEARASTRTGPEGTCGAVALPAGPLWAYAWADGFEGNDDGAPLAPAPGGDGLLAAEVVLEPFPGPLRSIAGRVTMPGGPLPSSAWVDLNDLRREQRQAFTAFGATGYFRFEAIPPGEYEVSTHPSIGRTQLRGRAPCRPGDDNVVLALERTPEEEPEQERPEGTSRPIRVLGPDGAPVVSATVWIGTGTGEDGDGFRLRAFDGSCSCPAGVDIAFVEVSGAVDAAGDLPGAAIAGPFPASTDAIEIRLPPGMSIAGIVRHEDGSPFPGVSVSARPARGDLTGRWRSAAHGGAVSGPGGRFEIRGLASMRYRIGADLGDDFVQGENVEADAGRTDVEVVPRAAAAPVVTVVDGDGRPLEGARIEVTSIRPFEQMYFRLPGRDPDTRYTVVPTGDDGKAVLAGLDPKKEYEFVVEAPRNRDDLCPPRIEKSPWTPADVVLVFGAGWCLASVARDGTGAILPDARLFRRTEEGRWAEAGETRGDGSFTLPRLPPGPVALRIGSVGDPAPDAPEQVTIGEGAGAAGVVFDPGPEIRIRLTGWTPSSSGFGTLADESEYRGMHSCVVGDGGLVRFVGLDPERRYAFWLQCGPEGRTAWRAGLVPSRETVQIPLVPALAIRGRVISPEGYRWSRDSSFAIITGPGIFSFAPIDADGRFVVEGLPPGTFRLSVDSYGLPPLEREVEAGTEIILDASGR